MSDTGGNPTFGGDADIDAYLDELFEVSVAAVNGRYKAPLADLKNLTGDVIKGTTPDTADEAAYAKLIKTVELASARNWSQAQLKARVERLGAVAMEIARKVPTLAALIV